MRVDEDKTSFDLSLVTSQLIDTVWNCELLLLAHFFATRKFREMALKRCSEALRWPRKAIKAPPPVDYARQEEKDFSRKSLVP